MEENLQDWNLKGKRKERVNLTVNQRDKQIGKTKHR